MAEFTGSALVVQWIGTGGTVTAVGVKSINMNKSANIHDVTAVGDSAERSIAGTIKGDFEIDTYDRQNAGTAFYYAMSEGAAGTLVVYPAGTASGMPKWKRGAVVEANNGEIAFDKPVGRKITGTYSGAWVWNGDLGDVV